MNRIGGTPSRVIQLDTDEASAGAVQDVESYWVSDPPATWQNKDIDNYFVRKLITYILMNHIAHFAISTVLLSDQVHLSPSR